MKNAGNRYEDGFSAIAAVIIAAVVIGGGAVLISNNDGGDDNNATSTTENEATAETESTVFSCEDGSEVVADLRVDGESTVTLPDGEVKVVSSSVAASGAKYTDASGSFVFWNKGQEATVEQDGEVTFDGCVAVDGEGDAETREKGDADVQSEVGATSSVEADTGASTSVEVEVEGEAQVQ